MTEAAPATSPSTRRRPFGLVAIIALFALQALFRIALLITLFLTEELSAEPASAWPIELLAEYGLLALSLEAIRLVAILTVLVALWARKRWAWYLVMLVLTWNMANDIFAYLQGQPAYISMFLNVLIVFYLNLREVRAHFIAIPDAPAPATMQTSHHG